jgi:hypothetical protein
MFNGPAPDASILSPRVMENLPFRCNFLPVFPRYRDESSPRGWLAHWQCGVQTARVASTIKRKVNDHEEFSTEAVEDVGRV